MSGLTRLLGLQEGGTVAVVGCGGKTSLIRRLAEENASRKVLVATTTHMFPPEGAALCADLEACASREPQNGVVCMGILDEKAGKLSALPPDYLAERAKEYDVTLLEADGSRLLPLKGWREDEPVVPPFCTHTVGVATVWPLGSLVRKDIVHRLPLFLELTGLREGDRVTVEALARMICAPGGMFKNAVGQRYLVINQVEDEAAQRNARELLAYITEAWPGFFTSVITGSANRNEWHDFSCG